MNRSDILSRLTSAEALFRARGVASLYLYGSRARDDSHRASDIDIFVDPADAKDFGFLLSMDIYAALQALFPGEEIGYSTRDGLVSCYRPHIERDAVRVF